MTDRNPFALTVWSMSILSLALITGGCATAAKNVPYPAFVQADEIEHVYLAEMPGIMAKRFSGDLRSGRFSALLYLPESWRWNTGASPGKSVEIYVIAGEITLADLTLLPGNHAYLPPGSMGLTMSTAQGAQVLYFLDDASPNAIIQTPLFMSREVVPWQPVAHPELGEMGAGLVAKELRSDPGSGARTFLMQVPRGVVLPWLKSSVALEGFLLSGDYTHSECVNGKAVTGEYAPGGYFQRPAGAINGGPEAGSRTGAVWLLREATKGTETTVAFCTPP